MSQSGNDSQKLAPAKQSVVWNQTDHPNNQTTVQYALIIGNNHVDIGSPKFLKNNVLVTPLTTDKENNIIYPSCALDSISNDNDQCLGKRMNNSDGCDRNRIVISSNSVATVTTHEGSRWSPGGTVSQEHSAASSAEGMLSGRSATGQGHQSQSDSTNTMLSAGAVPAPSVGVFRQSASIEPGQRLLSGAQFISAAGSPLGPYSPLYSVHGQPTHMTSISPYSAFYSQYPHGGGTYSPGSMLAAAAGHYPHIESYSAVLASMGNQVQHGGQTQLPRSPFLTGHLPQFSALGPHRVSSSAGSPGPSTNIHQTSAPHGALSAPHGASSATHGASSAVGHSQGESLASPKSESRDCDNRSQRGSTSSLREEKSSSLSPSSGGVAKSSMQHDSPKGHTHSEQYGSKDSLYKVPSGKEGSLKHRILTRPPDLPGNGSHVDDYKYHHQQHASPLNSPLSKRAKFTQFSEGGSGGGTGHPDEPSSTRDVRQIGQHHSTSGSPPPSLPCPPPHLHYPPHFMKGSIIQLANGELKHVENLQTEDFVNSAEISADLKIDSSTVVRIKEYPERCTAVLGFSVGEHRVQVSYSVPRCWGFLWGEYRVQVSYSVQRCWAFLWGEYRVQVSYSVQRCWAFLWANTGSR